MTPQYWNEAQAAAYQQFRYDFPEGTLSGKTVIVAGGSGGLGAATVALLARESAHLIVGYRANRERAEALRRSIESSFRGSIPWLRATSPCPRSGGSIWRPPKGPERRLSELPSFRATLRASRSKI